MSLIDQEEGSDWYPSDRDDPVPHQGEHSVEVEQAGSATPVNDEVDDDHAQSAPNLRADPFATQTRVSKSRKPYESDKRTKAPDKGPSRTSKWVGELTSKSEPKLRREVCCKTLKCYLRIDYDFFVNTSRRILTAPGSQRRDFLTNILDSDRQFRLNGSVVCRNFLKMHFHFSTVLMAEVSSGRITRPYNVTSSTSSRIRSSATRSASCASEDIASAGSTTSTTQTTMKKKDAILSFIMRVAEDCGDVMPNKNEVHLPFHQHQEIYPVFATEFKKLYPSMQPVSQVYFRRTWKSFCPHIKVMKSSRFTTCDVCDELKTALRNRIVKGESTSVIKEKRRRHLEFVYDERLEYQKKKDRARQSEKEFCSIIIDGADQSAFGLPHFTTTPKSQRGHAMKVKLVGLLEHRLRPVLSLFTMTQEHATGANHVVEVIHRFICRKRLEGPLPPNLFVQLDNCSRENKNKYVMAFLELLVSKSVFQSVEAGFLPVGHTHEDVDQAFSSTSSRLRVHNAITLEDLKREVRYAYGGNVHVEDMKRVANWSGLCDEKNCLRQIERVTHWRYFMFKPYDNDEDSQSDSGYRRTICYVRKDCHDQWVRLFLPSPSIQHDGILRTCPDLLGTPDLKISCPDGLPEVNKRLASEEGRINDPEKLISLHELRDFVFRNRVDKFHWDLGVYNNAALPQTNMDARTADDTADEITSREPPPPPNDADAAAPRVSTQNPSHSADDVEPTSKVDYAIDSFVVVQGVSNQGPKFWIGKVLSVEKRNGSSYVTHLRVHWYDAKMSSTDVGFSDAKFYPCYQVPANKRRKTRSTTAPPRQNLQKPSCDTIDTDTVLVSFEGLTKKHNLPSSVVKRRFAVDEFCIE